MGGFGFVDRMPNWLRWILYIPVPFIASRIVIILGSICTNLAVGGGFAYNSDSLIYSTLFILYDNAMTPIIMALAGFILAPKKKFIFGLIQAIIWGLIVICSLCITITVMVMRGETAYLASWEAIKLYIMGITSIIAIIYISVSMFRLEKQYIDNSYEESF